MLQYACVFVFKSLVSSSNCVWRILSQRQSCKNTQFSIHTRCCLYSDQRENTEIGNFVCNDSANGLYYTIHSKSTGIGNVVCNDSANGLYYTIHSKTQESVILYVVIVVMVFTLLHKNTGAGSFVCNNSIILIYIIQP